MSATIQPSPKTFGPLPLVLGVTGHRDLQEQDRLALEQGVRGIFTELRARYPSTHLVLLSPLAEGADRLVAAVALECDIRLIVPLPMKRSLYEQDFTAPESQREFEGLLQKAEKHFELDLVQGNTEESIRTQGDARNRQYAQVGAYIAAHSQILIALWDGAPTDKVGGSAQVVKFRLEGFPEPYAPPRSPLDPVEKGPVYHILTPRTSNPQPAGKPYTLHKLFPAGYKIEADAEAAHERILKRFDSFNEDDLHLAPYLTQVREEGKTKALSEEELNNLPGALRSILNWYATADSLAMHFQRLTFRILWALLFLAFWAAACYQIYAAGQSEPWVLGIVYLITLCVAYGLYLWAWWRDYHNKYLDYRAVAEGLRVHLFWRLAGLRDGVADHYLRKQRGELEWIRQALRVWSVPRRLDITPTALDPQRADLILKGWVKGQGGFFTKAGGRDYFKGWLIRYLGYGFLLLGLALAVVKVFVAPEHPLLVAMSLVLVIAALLHFYGKTMGLSEHAKQYGRMELVFANAEHQLTGWMANGNYGAAQALLRELGKEALAENGDWVLLHRERRPEIPH